MAARTENGNGSRRRMLEHVVNGELVPLAKMQWATVLSMWRELRQLVLVARAARRQGRPDLVVRIAWLPLGWWMVIICGTFFD